MEIVAAQIFCQSTTKFYLCVPTLSCAWMFGALRVTFLPGALKNIIYFTELSSCIYKWDSCGLELLRQTKNNELRRLG